MEFLTSMETASLFGTIRSAKDIDSDYAIKYTTVMLWAKESIDCPLHGYKRFLAELFKRLSTKRMKELQEDYKLEENGDFLSISKTIGIPLKDLEGYAISGIKWKKGFVDFLINIDKTMLTILYDSIIEMIKTQDFQDCCRNSKKFVVIKVDEKAKKPHHTRKPKTDSKPKQKKTQLNPAQG